MSGTGSIRRGAGAIATLSMIGRALIRQGEIVFAIEVRDGRVMLAIPASSWDVTGDVDPASWSYSLTLGGPSQARNTLEPVPSGTG